MEDLVFDADPSPDVLRALDDRIYEFNVAATGIDDGTLFAVLLRDEAGAVVAGLHGWTRGDTCEIKTLWVHADRRRAGLGSRLLATAEAEAQRRGVRQVVLSSHTFQAPGFYHRHGYETLFVLDGHPSPHGQHYLRKRLGPAPA